MAVDGRLDLKLGAADKQLLAQGAAIKGLSMAALAGWPPGSALQQSSSGSSSPPCRSETSPAFQAAISQPLATNRALQEALEQGLTRVSRV